jgi:threonine dehydratase
LDDAPPSLDEIRAARQALAERVRRTPVWTWEGPTPARLRIRPVLKLELWQHAGSFKPRGALLAMMALDDRARAAGVTAVSAGNHAMAVGYAASVLGTTAKVVMPRSANPARVQGCRAYGAEVVLVDDVHAAFAEVERIEAQEGRTFIHPFEGKATATGTATVGLELLEDAPDLDAIIVPVGGGGLLAGIATAAKALAPRCEVFGVEPEGADTMHRSFAAGHPCAIDQVRTIADSLGAPHAAPYSFGLCRRFVDDLVRVDDDALCRAMWLLFSELKLAVEPAGAAATAALVGPLAERLRDRKVGIVVCGANIDPEAFAGFLRRGSPQ